MKVSESVARDFLALPRLAVVGASDDPKKFGNTIYKELKAAGLDVVPVNSRGVVVEGDPSFVRLADVPARVDGVIVMVKADAAADVVQECVDLGIPNVWLFKGAGTGAVSEGAVELARRHGLRLVAGACPLMFLEPAAWIHRAHRTLRRLGGSLEKAA
ncbi:MAG TPA: CoA-binding protein [Acidimicrobiales bacterium]|nr:CoA-binding protein [Acidimicrobiales bacterium]